MPLRILGLLFVSMCLFAQDYRAKVQGLVTDSSDASIPGAKVTLLNTGTGIAATKMSGPNGSYLFDNVEPGTYTVTAEMDGFSKQVQDSVLVQTRADVTVNFALKPGALVETVTVSATAVTLQFNTTTRELTVDRKMLMDLPVKARNPFTLALLDPAVVNRYFAERNPFFMWSSSTMDVGRQHISKERPSAGWRPDPDRTEGLLFPSNGCRPGVLRAAELGGCRVRPLRGRNDVGLNKVRHE